MIAASQLSKRYRLGALGAPYGRLTESISNLATRPFKRGQNGGTAREKHIWALRDFSFEVQQGEVVGIVGPNGAGKTTLLKLLSRITEPTEGSAELHGRVGSLLEVGTGFHPELSGRENIFLNGAILGMGRAEIRSKYDEIVAFAEVERFIDTPVKRYSSGMQVRLAFAVAAHLEPEILIIDEVLAVGDMAFQRKCLGKMEEVAHSGRTILFVSHNMGAVAELCTRAVLIDQGRKVTEGSVADVLDAYARIQPHVGSRVLYEETTELPVQVLAVHAERSDGGEASSFDVDEEVVLCVQYEVRTPVDQLMLVATLSRNMVDIFHSYSSDLGEPAHHDPGVYEARLRIPAMFLKAGVYSLALGSTTPDTDFELIDPALRFEVDELSHNTNLKGYRRDRPGHVISPGVWDTVRLG